jgi:ketosteroid isomerase-like protein
MTNSDALDVIRRCYAAFGRGDMDGLLGLMDPDIVWRTPGPADLPTAGRWRGLRQVAQFFSTMFEIFEMARFEPQTFVADGGNVIVLGEETLVVRASGARIDIRWAHAWGVQAGRVISFEDYLDTAEVMAALRAIPAQA